MLDGKQTISFAPHTQKVATDILQAVADRIEQEGQQDQGKGSVLFAAMEIDQGQSPVYKVLNELHSEQSIFSYGISDGPEGISLYKPGSTTGVLVTGKPQHTQLGEVGRAAINDGVASIKSANHELVVDLVPNAANVGHLIKRRRHRRRRFERR